MSRNDLTEEYFQHLKKHAALMSAVKNNNLQALRQIFPSYNDFFEHDEHINDIQQPVLETLVTYSSSEFIEKVFDTYFPDNEDDTLSAKNKFLQTTNRHGQKFNYHYFCSFLPAEQTTEISTAYGVKPPYQSSENTPHTISRMEQIYQILKSQNKSITYFRNRADTPLYTSLRKSDDQTVINTDVIDKNRNPSATIEAPAIQSIYIRKVNGLDNSSHNFLDDEYVKLDIGKDLTVIEKEINLVEQLYKTADFPEDYMWAIPSLNKFTKEYSAIINDSFNSSQLKSFIGHSCFFIESDHSNNNCNTINKDYIAFAGTRSGYDVIVIDSGKYGNYNSTGNTLLHELIHKADTYSFSNSPLFHSAAPLMIAENLNGMIANKACHILNGYEPGALFTELIAYMNEENADNLAYSQIAPTIRNLYHIYTEAKAHNNTAVMKQITNFIPSFIIDTNRDFNLNINASGQRDFTIGSTYTAKQLQQQIPQFCNEIAELNRNIIALQYLQKEGMDIPELFADKIPVYTIYLDAMNDYHNNTADNTATRLKHINKALAAIPQATTYDECVSEDFKKSFQQAAIYAAAYIDEGIQSHQITYKQPQESIWQRTNYLNDMQPYYYKEIIKELKDEATYLKHFTTAPCSKNEALLADDLNISITELQIHQKAGSTHLKMSKNYPQTLQKLLNRVQQSRSYQDALKFLGAIEYIAQQHHIENPLEYRITNAAMLEAAVLDIGPKFIDKHLETFSASTNSTNLSNRHYHLRNHLPSRHTR